MAKPTPLSGFPEWLPDGRIVEQHVLDTLRRVFELHGFAGIETRAVEPLDQLLRKGETSKEVYVLSRLQEEEVDRSGVRGECRSPPHENCEGPKQRSDTTYVLCDARRTDTALAHTGALTGQGVATSVSSSGGV